MPSPDPYPVMEIERSWTQEDEAMGTKSKFWFRPAETSPRWLFKYPQPGTGQHWAEKIAAEIAARLGIPHAIVELATFCGEHGSASKAFTYGRRSLIHGNEVLAATMPYDMQKHFGHSAHTLDHIFRAFDQVFTKPAGATIAKRHFVRYMVLDALIGNTDRHHENWGLLVKWTPNGLRGIVAPSFDHASSMGRELREEKRAQRLRDHTVGQYSENARGAVYWTDEGRYGPSPLDLVRTGSRNFPDLFHPPIARLAATEDSFTDPIRRVPTDWMSDTAKDFTAALLRYNASEILKCLN